MDHAGLLLEVHTGTRVKVVARDGAAVLEEDGIAGGGERPVALRSLVRGSHFLEREDTPWGGG